MFSYVFEVVLSIKIGFWAGLGSDLTIEQTLMRSPKSSGGLTRGSGMTEEVRTIWTLSSCVSSAYNLAMQEFTELSFTSSEQHKDSTTPRIQRDQEDRVKLMQELLHCNPFSKDSELRNVVTGVVANEDVNVHEYEAVGKAIVQKMVGQPIFTYSFKRKDKVKTLGDSSLVKVNAEQAINPELLFQRFLVVSQAGDLTLNDIMDYELSPYPPALFEAKHVFLKADKPQLAHALRDFVSQSSSNAVITDSIPESEHFVLDGGSLLHRLSWKKGITYGEIAEEYVNFTFSKYGMATVVFDGYSGEPSIKDNEHQRRQRKSHPVVRFDSNTVFSSGRLEDFLSKDSNKQQMINLISGKLKDRGCEVIHAHGDADVDIVKAAVASAKLRDTTLVGEDTDILILLLYYVERDSKKLYFRSDKLKSEYVYDICSLKDLLGCEVSTQLLFVHAFTGCDSTSRIYGIGKKALFQKLIKNDSLIRACAAIFTTADQDVSTIVDSGCKIFVSLFGGKVGTSLANLRNSLLAKKVSSAKSFVKPEKLPPTVSAAKFHSQRAFYQIMVWMGKDGEMDPKDWGWKHEDNFLLPVMTDQKPAPETLLKVIHCNCTTGCCNTRCSCRKYGLACTTACGPCQAESCYNPHNESTGDPDEDADDNLAVV